MISEAEAACLPAVATRDNGTEEKVTDGVTGLFVPHEHPPSVAAALDRLRSTPARRPRPAQAAGQQAAQQSGARLHRPRVARRWQALFDEGIADANGEAPILIHRGGAEYAEIQTYGAGKPHPAGYP